jgi:hypothetical protein
VKPLIVVLLVAVVAVLVLLVVVIVRFGRRSYQRYSGLEHQRGAAKQARETAADRLKNAERHLIEAQRELIARREYDGGQAIEHLRTRLSTLADRLRHATYGYSPVGSPNPIREAELAELQERDSETITEAQIILELAQQVNSGARDGENPPDLKPLRAAVDHLLATLDRRRTVT